MNAIEITGLKKSFGDIKAVDDISFFVKRGSLFAFLGLNGAGKSTTINIICTLLKRTRAKCASRESPSIPTPSATLRGVQDTPD